MWYTHLHTPTPLSWNNLLFSSLCCPFLSPFCFSSSSYLAREDVRHRRRAHDREGGGRFDGHVHATVLTELRVGCVCGYGGEFVLACFRGCETNNARQPRNKDGPQVRTSWTVRVRGAILLVHSRYYTLQCGACADREATAEGRARRDVCWFFFARTSWRSSARRSTGSAVRASSFPDMVYGERLWVKD